MSANAAEGRCCRAALSIGAGGQANVPPLPLPLAESSVKLEESMWLLCKEFLSFLKQEKKWWLIPLVVVLLMFAGLILFGASSVLAPFMYPFM